jgi:hypothetical protein
MNALRDGAASVRLPSARRTRESASFDGNSVLMDQRTLSSVPVTVLPEYSSVPDPGGINLYSKLLLIPECTISEAN